MGTALSSADLEAEVWLKTELIINAVSYCRLMHLSMHRAKGDLWQEIGEYISEQKIPLPSEIMDSFEPVKPPNFKDWLGRIFSAIAARTGFCLSSFWVEDDAVARMRSCLAAVDRRLAGQEDALGEQDLRFILADLEQQMTRSLPKKVRRRILEVDHLNSADHLRLTSYNDLVSP